jgi:hypothetical protein
LFASGKGLYRLAGSLLSFKELERQMLAFFPTRSRCVACQVREASEKDSLGRVRSRLKDEAKDDAVGLCLPHLTRLIRQIENPGITKALLEQQAGSMRRMAEQMERYALRRDALSALRASIPDGNKHLDAFWVAACLQED